MGFCYRQYISLLVCILVGSALAAPSWQDATPADGFCESDSGSPCTTSTINNVQIGRGILQASSDNSTHPAEHKTLFPTSQYDVAMFVIAGVVLFVAAGAGMGGGPVLVPVYLTLGGFMQQAAVALSNSTILAGSIANVLVNARKRHPFKNRPLVDWDLILLMQPPTLIGAVAGSFINKLVPAWISHLLLAVLLTLMAVRVVQRAIRMYKKETLALEQQISGGCEPTATGSTAEHVHSEPPQQQGTLMPQPVAAAPTSPTTADNITVAENNRGVIGTCINSQLAATQLPSTSNSNARTSSTRGPVTVQLAVMTPGNCRVGPVQGPLASPAGAEQLAATVVGSADRVKPYDSKLPSALMHGQQSQQQQQQPDLPRSSLEASSTAELPPNEVECRLAYAPPGHTRRNSWELQEGWDDAWEPHDSSEEANSPAHNLGGLFESAGDHRASAAASDHTAAAAADAAKLLHACRASSAPVADTLAPLPTASTGQQGGTSSTKCTRLNTSSSAHCLGVTDQLSPSVADSPTPIFDARAIIHKPPTPDDSSRPSSVLSKYLKPRPRRPPPELSINSPELQAFLVAEAAQLPPFPVLLLGVMFVAVLLTSLFSKTARCGSVAYWLIQVAVAPALLVVWLFGRRRVLRKIAVKRAAGLDFHGDIRWTHRNSIVFPAICSFAGVMAGMFGLGGAVVTTPVMLELGVNPQVTAATSQTMLLLTTAASTIVYSQLGDIPWNYAAVLMPMAFVATLGGQFAIDKVVATLRRSSVVVIVVAGFFVVACCLTYYVVIDSLRGVVAHPASATIPGRLCGTK